MPKPLSRRELTRKLKGFGFSGPFLVTKHQYMLKNSHKVFIPNSHSQDIGRPIIRNIINQIGIEPKEWEKF